MRLEHPAARTTSNALLSEKISEIHTQSRGNYGSPRIV
jgi:hypothetical protein